MPALIHASTRNDRLRHPHAIEPLKRRATRTDEKIRRRMGNTGDALTCLEIADCAGRVALHA